eukprot:scaffold422770_cov55-Attheya_sp.AAC.1
MACIVTGLDQRVGDSRACYHDGCLAQGWINGGSSTPKGENQVFQDLPVGSGTTSKAVFGEFLTARSDCPFCMIYFHAPF